MGPFYWFPGLGMRGRCKSNGIPLVRVARASGSKDAISGNGLQNVVRAQGVWCIVEEEYKVVPLNLKVIVLSSVDS